MDMVRHQHVSVKRAAVPARRFGELLKIVAVVRIGGETRLPIHPSLYDMLSDAWQFESGLTSHECGASCNFQYLLAPSTLIAIAASCFRMCENDGIQCRKMNLTPFFPFFSGTQIMLPAQQFERHSIRNFWY